MKNTEHSKKIRKSLLDKYLAKTASEEEIAELKGLAQLSGKLKKKLDESEKIFQQMDDLEFMTRVDTPRAFAKVKDELQKVKDKKGWLYYWQRVAAVMILPFFLLSVVQFFLHRSETFARLEGKTALNEMHTPPGLRSVFELPDGTKVWLNGNTKIIYPMGFDGDERRVQLEGEAYFKVAPNKKKPFIVDMGTLYVLAVGTEFNCMAYPSENVQEVSLNEGVVKVLKEHSADGKGSYVLEQGQILTYEIDKGQFFLEKEELEKHIAWRNGKFVFRNDPLELVCQKLGRWFNADIQIKNEELKTYSFTGTFTGEGLNEILDLISITSPVQYNIGNRKINKSGEYEKLKVTIESKKRR